MSGYIYKMEYYSFLKENETLSFWSSIMLSETSQTRDKYHMSSFTFVETKTSAVKKNGQK